MGTKPIKILFAINCLNIGGAPSVVVNQIKSLDQNMYEPHLLTLYPSKQHNYFSELSFLGDKQIHTVHLKNRSIFDVKTIWRIFRLLKREKFDIVYTHLFLANFLVRLCALCVRTPIIISFEHSIYAHKRMWQIWVDRLLAKVTTRIIVSTESVAHFTMVQQKIPLEKIIVVPNPVSVPRRDDVDIASLYAEFSIPTDKKIVLYIARFSEEKGYHILIDAITLLNNPDIYVVMVGHGNLEHELREKVVTYNIADRAIIINAPQRAKEFLYLADIFVLPSLREGQGIVVYEAMMTGLPVLASDLLPIRSIITHGQNGFLFETGNSKALSYTLQSIIYNNKLLRDVAENALETMKTYEKTEQEKQIAYVFQDLYTRYAKHE